MEKLTRYLSIMGSLASILALLITVSAKFEWAKFVSYLIGIIGAFFLGAFMFWGAHQLYEIFIAKLSNHWTLKGLFYFICVVIIALIVVSVFMLLSGASNALITSFIEDLLGEFV